MISKVRAGLLAGAFFFIAASCGAAGDVYEASVKIQTLLKTSVDSAGQKIKYPSEGTPEVTGLLVEVPVGQNTGWHLHPNPCVAYIMQGEITVNYESGEGKRFVAGESFAEVVNLKHCGVNTGSVPVKILFFSIGEKGAPISLK